MLKQDILEINYLKMPFGHLLLRDFGRAADAVSLTATS